MRRADARHVLIGVLVGLGASGPVAAASLEPGGRAPDLLWTYDTGG